MTLTFNNAPERLIIPLRSITVFADPSVNFVLPFQATDAVAIEEAPAPAPAPKAAPAPAIAKPAAAKEPEDGDKGAQVVSLDKFRKK